jgi:hypothetical protein
MASADPGSSLPSTAGPETARLFQIGLDLLTANAIAGVMTVTWFTEDLGGAPTTPAGIGHVVFASASSIAVVVGSFVYGSAFRRMGRPWRVISIAANSDLAGLAERAAIRSSSGSSAWVALHFFGAMNRRD